MRTKRVPANMIKDVLLTSTTKILTLRAPMETLVSHAVVPVPPDIVHVFLPIAPGYFQHDHGKA